MSNYLTETIRCCKQLAEHAAIVVPHPVKRQLPMLWSSSKSKVVSVQNNCRNFRIAVDTRQTLQSSGDGRITWGRHLVRQLTVHGREAFVFSQHIYCW